MCFTWNTPVMVQSERIHVYREVFSHLRDRDLVYPCGCSRKEIEVGESGCTCAQGLSPGKSTRAWRVRGGDFVLLRADGIFAYQLAVVVDDAAQGITDVVRGADLLDSTPRQNYLQGLLGYPVPRYKHVPVVLAPDGQKLSKQTGAAALDLTRPGELLWDAFAFLGLNPPAELREASPKELWPWGTAARSTKSIVDIRFVSH
jgi:glutamyl-Q tRNA(Asp) synthetase